MYVNPFWFGVLMTFVVEIIVAIIMAIAIRGRGEDDDDHEQK